MDGPPISFVHRQASARTMIKSSGEITFWGIISREGVSVFFFNTNGFKSQTATYERSQTGLKISAQRKAEIRSILFGGTSDPTLDQRRGQDKLANMRPAVVQGGS